MQFATSKTPSSTANVTETSSARLVETALHLRGQLCILIALFGKQSHKLSKPEQEWIQNATSHTQQTLDLFFARFKEFEVDTHRAFPSLALSSKARQARSEATFWQPQFLIATQNLNGAMSLLSRCAHTDSHDGHSAGVQLHCGAAEELSKVELSRFLNDRRAGRNGTEAFNGSQAVVHNRDVENTIAELRATNSILRNDRSNINTPAVALTSNELPLTLVETVERWRQNAEEALKAAMVQYFEQEELFKGTVNTQTSEEIAGAESETDLQNNSKHDSTAIQTPIKNNSSELKAPLRQISAGVVTHPDNLLNAVPRRKPVARVALSNGSSASPPINIAATSPILSERPPVSPLPPPSNLASPIDYTLSNQVSHESPTSLHLKKSLTRISPTPNHQPSATSLIPNGDAQVSAVSLLSTGNLEHHRVSHDEWTEWTDSAVSLPRQTPQHSPYGSSPPSRPEPWPRRPLDTSYIGHQKSRGRRWLERQAAMDGD